MKRGRDTAARQPIGRGLDSTRVSLLVAVLVVTSVWGLCLIGMSLMRAELEATIARGELAVAQQLADEVDRNLRERRNGLAADAARLDSDRITDPAYVRNFLADRTMLQRRFPGGTAVVGIDGHALAGYPETPEREDLYFGDRDYLHEAIATRQPYIGKPAMGPVFKRPTLFMSAPVFGRGGEIKAVLVGHIDLTDPNIFGLFGATGHIGGIEVYLISLKDNLFIIAPESHRQLAALPAPGVSPISDRLQAGFEGSMVGRRTNGTEKLVSVQKLPTTGWLLELAVPTELVFKPVRRMQTIILLSGLGVTLLSLLVIGSAWLRFFTPLRAATRELDRMTSGHGVQRRLPEAGGAEVRSLCVSFNKLLACIETQEALLASVVDSTHHLIWSVHAVSFGLLTFNAGYQASFQRALGLRLEKGMQPEDMLPAELAGAWRIYYQRALNEAPYSVEHHAVLNGLMLRVHFKLLKLDGQVFAISVFAEDITELSRQTDELARHRDHLGAMVATRTAELERALAGSADLLASLRKSEALYRGVGESIDYGVWVAEADGRNSYGSASFLKMVGFTQQQCSGFGWCEALHPDDVAATIAAVHECVRSGGNWDRELRFRSVDGTWRHVLSRGVPVRDENGIIVCWAGLSLDITKLKQTEEDLRIAKEIAERADTAKSRFLAAASHDLRQPLAALGIYTHILSDKVLEPEQEVVSRMQECIVGLSALLNDLLDLSKLAAGVVTARHEAFPLAGLLDNLWSAHNPVAEAKGLRMRRVPTRLIAFTDPVLLQRIVGNFIDNALRYSQRGGVVVGCRRRQGRMFVEVWDSGPGIPADKRSEIFEEFRQLGDEARNSGSGLGLAIAAKAAALLGLEIEVRSRLGRGSVFAVEIPRGEAPARPAVPARPTLTLRPPLRIALVEDNRLVRDALEVAMQEAGHQLVSAASGDELLAALGALPPDALVSDYRLANGSTGFAVIAALQAKFGRDIPAIIITGDTDPALLRDMADRGIIVLHKPLDLEDLQACLDAVTSPASVPTV